ncbi:LON peptidase N-terminal domain and RING finger protein 3 [Nymphaea thermarum]|nr:LON peptidase N-terminal domain and RING finger protein 3 [Nymphaea thermarum]
MVDASSAAVILKDLEEFDAVEEFQLGDHGQQSMSPELFRLVFDLVHKGNRAFREGRFKEAINFYSKARLSEECETIVLSNRSAAFCSYSKQLRSRSASLSEYQAIDGLDPTTYAELALKDAEKVMNVQPNSTKVHYLRAKALILLERYDAAKETLVVGLQIDPLSIPLQRSIQNLDKITAGSERRMRCSKLQRTDDFDCTLCFKLLYDPVTTPCGHSFCRPCLLQSMDHGNKCPMCRTVLFISAKAYPVSVTLKNIIQKNFADEYAERKSELDSLADMGNDVMPLFVMDVVIPGQKISLNIFEPRYRLMPQSCPNLSLNRD